GGIDDEIDELLIGKEVEQAGLKSEREQTLLDRLLTGRIDEGQLERVRASGALLSDHQLADVEHPLLILVARPRHFAAERPSEGTERALRERFVPDAQRLIAAHGPVEQQASDARALDDRQLLRRAIELDVDARRDPEAGVVVEQNPLHLFRIRRQAVE